MVWFLGRDWPNQLNLVNDTWEGMDMEVSVTSLRSHEEYGRGVTRWEILVRTKNGSGQELFTVHESETLEGAFNGVIVKALCEHGVSLGAMPMAYMSAVCSKKKTGTFYQASAQVIPRGEIEIIVVTSEHQSPTGALLLSMVEALKRLGVTMLVECL